MKIITTEPQRKDWFYAMVHKKAKEDPILNKKLITLLLSYATTDYEIFDEVNKMVPGTYVKAPREFEIDLNE